MAPILVATTTGAKLTLWVLIPVALVAALLLYSARRSGCDFSQWEGGCRRVKVAGFLFGFVLLGLVFPAIGVLAVLVPTLGVLLGVYLQNLIDRRERR